MEKIISHLGVNKLPRELRVFVSIALGIVIIFISHYAGKATDADLPFVEMFHAAGDVLVFILLFASFFVRTQSLLVLRKIAGVTLCAAGIISFTKAYTTFVDVAMGIAYFIDKGLVLLVTGTLITGLIVLQMMFLGEEHEIFHEHDHNDAKHVHNAATPELFADLIQATGTILEYLVILIMPTTYEGKIFVRFFDLMLTIVIGTWMIYRGMKIVFAKKAIPAENYLGDTLWRSHKH